MQSEFKIIDTEVSGTVHIKTNTQINHLIAENVVVEENITARLFGVINKVLILKKNSKVFLHGSIYGIVNNEGGELHFFRQDHKNLSGEGE